MTEHERRSRKRHVISHRKYVAYDQITGKLLGTLANIHVEGLMLIGGEDLQEDAVFQIILKSSDDDRSISLGIDCVWSKEAQIEGKRWAGFQIIDASDETIRKILDLIESRN